MNDMKTEPYMQRISTQKARALRIVGALAALAAIIVAGLFMRYPELGNALILAYGVVSLFARIPSKTTYAMAFILLLVIPFASAFGQDEVVQFFTVYAFLLLCIGTIMYAVEQKVKNSKEHR